MIREYRNPIQRLETGRGKKLRRTAVLGVLLLLSAVTQSAAGAAFFNYNFRPDLVLIVCLWYTLRRGGWNGWGVGIAGGLVKDLFSLGHLGLGIFSLGGACAFAWLISRPFDRAHPVTLVAMTAAAALCASMIYFILSAAFRGPVSWSDAWIGAIRPHLWQTTVASAVWLPLTAALLRD